MECSESLELVFKDFQGTDAAASAVEFSSDNTYYSIVPVPEPAHVFGGLGLVGLVAYRERRRMREFLGI
jgi:hypothetical protein